MKKLKVIVAAVICGAFFTPNLAAQKLAEEKVVELTGKSKRKGYLGNVVIDDTKQQFDMVFVTKDKARKVVYEVYQFDYNFNLLNNFEDEQRKPKSKRGKNKVYKGDFWQVTGVTASPNLTGKLVLRKTLYTYQWNWWKGGYEITKQLLDKEKPKEMASDGDDKKRKLYYTSHRDLSDKGELLVCALINKGNMVMYKEASREYQIMHIDKDLNILKKTPLKFDNPQALLYSAELEDRDEWIMVFQNYGGAGLNKIAADDPTGLTFVRVDGAGNIVENYKFNTKCNEWAIFDAYYVGDDVYLYGAGNINKPEKNYTKAPFCITADVMPGVGTPEQRMGQLENLKYGYLQVTKLSGGKAEFVTATSIDDINAKGIKPAGQKKLREFDGKKFILNGVTVTSTGDLFISGQDFKYDNVGEVKGRVYKDLLMFQFDSKGEFKRYYGVENTAKSAGLLGGAGGAKSYPAEFTVYQSPTNPNDLFWNVFLCKDIDVDCESETSTNYLAGTQTTTTTCVYTPLYQGMLGKINASEGTISDFNVFGGDDFYLYIDLEDDGKGKDLPYFSINNGNQIVYVARKRKGGIKGNERWGNEVWFGKFDPAKQ
ncbi:MAG: hypothetical protein KDD41_12605 [Flavobacteriales bacterium]|nr:hypothetical protein [Flavobacteriales bacterium]